MSKIYWLRQCRKSPTQFYASTKEYSDSYKPIKVIEYSEYDKLKRALDRCILQRDDLLEANYSKNDYRELIDFKNKEIEELLK